MSVSFDIGNKDNCSKGFANTSAISTSVKASTNFDLQHSIPARHKRQYKCLPFLVTLCMALIVCHYVFTYKLVPMYFGMMSLGSIFIPFWQMIDDIIAEVYGLKMFMRMFWATWFIIIIQVILYTFAFFSDPSTAHQGQYQFVFQEMTSVPFFVYLTFAGYVSNRINGYLLIKWKILLNGKWFWLRSIGSTILCDILFLSMIIPAWINLAPIFAQEALSWTIYSILFRFVVYVLLAYPMTIFVNLLKVIENVDCYEQVHLNPFIQPKKN